MTLIRRETVQATTQELEMKTIKPRGSARVSTFRPPGLKDAVTVEIEDLVQEEVDGVPRLCLLLVTDDGQRYRMVLTRELAEDLVLMLGPHPLITQFFKLN